MNTLLTLVFRVLSIFIYALQDLMFIRAILSWIPGLQDNIIARFIYGITEPFIAPVREFMNRFEFVRTMPVDLSFIVTYILLVFIQGLLPNV